ncbi:Cof-type HAD-IIB family hydrolase [Herbiconiux sp.]|uniref:Cof-type HAD-IIB family hydrolase n=1 Tax=Herbiconiux sp. TaxID=1871186 RepID=UPI0025C6BAC3|nr:Cof-type HAD-IIB family hydrolase [Herbiconiux sp.]
MSTSRIAFLDVDGTLIDSGERIAPSTIDAIRTARSNGHLVYVCTGRAAVEIYPVIRDIGFDGTISAGGGFAAIGDELVISRTMPPETAERMARFFEQAGIDFYLQSYTEVFPSAGVRDRFIEYLLADVERTTGGPADAESLAALDAHPAIEAFSNVRPIDFSGIAKAVFLGSDHTAFERVRDGLGEDFHVITATIPHLGSSSGEVSLGGVNKGSTILQLLERLDIPVSASLGIGDSSNDVEMLQVCGVGIAMGNATDEIKAHADEVTTAVLDDGVWNAFRRHGLV